MYPERLSEKEKQSITEHYQPEVKRALQDAISLLAGYQENEDTLGCVFLLECLAGLASDTLAKIQQKSATRN